MLNQVIRAIARRARLNDFIGRITDDTFVVVCPFTPKSKALILAEDIKTLFKSLSVNPILDCHIGVSGIESYDLSSDELIENANHSIEFARNLGRNQIVVI